ncbi:DNA-binding protein [Rhodococcus sp. 15-725-2-2b]|uniref:XRE family transcriptional regulator n=1 Tax=unclassified Rhodococcus (in: high G+C Gram-positive bacteria) TaxID=192944 RepID=UPI000B9B7F11|nr:MULTISPECIES: XRE family transcriptional regulator [unclassified Rhodococcus (in: high G+C Gram-positive bacteria)]OZC60509.1 DNA-binding protein [Rhodococcus sp. 06-469-3-2]OZC73793.1 DNA-binding protein [Rhodococcus sp. 06-418-5]OZD40966.1 DNA-binding protein [Rhodococcus sp. 06-1477-1A]OZE01694.1 DNA-binding protein [Rhodococcus sp. 05-2255-3C]OZE07276.1 DNA-binding protein [Rhodococcus sp. 05-2255-3B1]
MNDDRPQLELFTSAVDDGLSSVAVAFEPARLTQARVLAELTKSELAEQVGVSAAAIGQFEAGITKPRPEHLPILSKTLGVPVRYFAAGRPIGRLDAADAHFRSLRSTRSKDRSKAAAHAEQVWELTHALEKQVRFPDVNLPVLPSGASPTEAADVLRKWWAVSAGPVPHLAGTMEANGIVVCLISMTDDALGRVKAYSTDALGRPIVVLTPERFRSVQEYRFTCAHELGHLLMHPTALPGDRQQEREADQFAAEFLTPQAQIAPLLPKTVRISTLDGLSREWGVSIESLIYRMGELHLVTEAAIRRAHQRLAGMTGLRNEEPLVSFPGEVPTLLRDALKMAEKIGYSRADLADELRWTEHHLAKLLGEIDTRPRLSLVSRSELSPGQAST